MISLKTYKQKKISAEVKELEKYKGINRSSYQTGIRGQNIVFIYVSTKWVELLDYSHSF